MTSRFMAPRDTRTGSVLEEMILPALGRGGYTFRSRVKVGQRFGGGAHYVDVAAEKLGEKIRPLIRRLYGSYRMVRIEARRSISCNPRRRGPLTELVVLNY